MNMRNRLIFENFVKNIILVVLFVWLFEPIRNIIFSINLDNIDSVLIYSSLTSVAALFGNFAFTYEYCNVKNRYERFIGHMTTFLLMLAIGLLLEVSSLAISMKIDSMFYLSVLISVLIYSATVLYDFWDLYRTKI